MLGLKDDQISESGTYKKLLNKNDDFANFLILYMQEQNIDKVNETEIHKLLENIADLKEKYNCQRSESNSKSEMQRKTSIYSESNIPAPIIEHAKIIEVEKVETFSVK